MKNVDKVCGFNLFLEYTIFVRHSIMKSFYELCLVMFVNCF
jgi:hypothetical protein